MVELATVRIHRPARLNGVGSAIVIEVDGREVGRLRNDQSLVTHVEAGRHNIRARQWSVSDLLELELVPGGYVELETRYETRHLTYIRPVLVQTGVSARRPEELATVRIHRPRLNGTGFAAVIEVDGREVGRLRSGQNLVTHVDSGRHTLRARHWFVNSKPLELELTPGADVSLETRYETTVWNYWLLLVPTTAAPVRPTAQVLGVTETHRSEEPIGTQNVRIGTSDAARLTRTTRVTREWSRTVSLDIHASRGGQLT